jgi:photosystem II stability/assembly factor-like uncharacterized protein
MRRRSLRKPLTLQLPAAAALSARPAMPVLPALSPLPALPPLAALPPMVAMLAVAALAAIVATTAMAAMPLPAVPGMVTAAMAALGSAAIDPPVATAGAVASEPPAAMAGASAPAPAASPAPAAWQVLPIWGGDIRSLVVAPDDPDLVFAGTSTGQLYLSRDGGASWADAGAPLPFPGWVVSSLRWDPNHHQRLWVALWGVWGGGQVAYSDNLGRTWVARSTGLPDEPVYSLALAPANERRLFAGTRSGVWGTEDGGASWQRLTAALPEMEKVTSLIVDPTRPDTVIAGTWRQAYRSDDGGRTWAGIFQGMVLDTEIFSFTAIPEHPGEIWASSCGWVYQTLDRGDHWQRWKDGLDERRTLSFAALPDGRLLAGTVTGLFDSTDGAHSWKRISDPALSVSAIAFHPARPQRILLGTEGAGVWISTDGGGDFFRASRGMTATRVGALALAGNDLLVAVNQAGPVSGVYVSRDRGKTFTADFAPLPTVLDLAVFGSHAYAATERGLFERRGIDWHRLPELGQERVEQLAVEEGPHGAHLAARTPDAIYELARGTFVRRPYKHGPLRSAVFYDGTLWVTDANAVYELTGDANRIVPAPGSGHLVRLGDQLLLAGPGGAWARSAPAAADRPAATAASQAAPVRPAGAKVAAARSTAATQAPPSPAPPAAAAEGDAAPDWLQLTDQSSRLIPTGDDRFAALLQTGEAVRLYDRETRRFRALPLPVPARDVVAALVVDGKLLLATSGYGVLVLDLDAGPSAERAAAGR